MRGERLRVSPRREAIGTGPGRRDDEQRRAKVKKDGTVGTGGRAGRVLDISYRGLRGNFVARSNSFRPGRGWRACPAAPARRRNGQPSQRTQLDKEPGDVTARWS